jgi:hypothetical protein
MHESGTFVRLTEAGAALFAYPRGVREQIRSLAV